MLRLLIPAWLLFAGLPLPADAQQDTPSPLLARGEYIMQISGCRHCHTAEDGAEFAGGRPLETPFGTFYTPNITAHDSAGIGTWSEDEFLGALKQGESPSGDYYYPAFPFTAYTRMSNEDARALYAYLRSRPVSDRPNREHELAWFLSWRIAALAWQWLFFTPGELEPDPAKNNVLNRGEYLAEALAHCQECHTPRNWFGALRHDFAYAGNADGPEGELVPNITPHPDTGIGDWSRESLQVFLQFGELPNGEYTAGSMDAVIQGLNKMTETDRGALIEYLHSLPPIDNRVTN